MANRRIRTALLVIGTLIVGVALLAAIAYVALRPLVERRVLEEARARGVLLVIGGLGFDWSSVRIDDARFELEGVRGLRGKVRQIRVALDGTTPERIALDTPELVIEADPFTLMSDLRRWKARHPSTGSGSGRAAPIGATNVAVSWTLPDSKWFDLSVMGATAAYAEPTASLVGARASMKGKSIGPFGLYVDAKRWVITLGYDIVDPAAAPVRIELTPDAPAPSAKVTFAKAPASRVLGVLGVPLADEPIAISGSAELTLGPEWTGEGKGAVALTIEGFVPPHPVELSPFVFGNTTTVSANLSLDAAWNVLRLDNARVAAGAFALFGKGTLERAPDHGTLEMTLDGDLGCAALADATAKSRLGALVGGWVGTAAKQALNGSVHVGVRLSADTRELARAKMIRNIGIGCGLKPLALPDPKALPTLEDLTKNLPPMPDLGPGFMIPNGIEPSKAPATVPAHPIQ